MRINRNGEIDPAQIAEGTTIPMFVLDSEHRIIHYNRACEKLTGLNRSDLIGTRDQWRAFYHSARPVLADLLIDGADEERITSLYQDRFRKSRLIEGAYEAEGFFPDLGESGKWLFFTASPLKDGEGRIVGAIETLQDITDQKTAEASIRESRRRYRTLLDFLPYPIVGSRLDGTVVYVNPAFTETFGWSLDDIRGKHNPYIPEELECQADDDRCLLKEKGALSRYITRRQTRDGHLLHMAVTATVYPEYGREPAGILEIMRDITTENLESERRELMVRITRSLPEYPDLEDLLDYVSDEIKTLTGTEGAVVILLDEVKQELFFPGASYDDAEQERRTKEIRFGLDELVAGQVIRTGEPIIVHDTAQTPDAYPERDRKLGYHTRNFLIVPLRSSDRIIGVLGAMNKKEGRFDESHIQSLDMLSGLVSLSIENARFAEEVKQAYREVSSLNWAKDRAITHLSHELRTPLAVLGGSLKILSDRLAALPEEQWRPTLERARRNLARMARIQDESEEIMHHPDRETGSIFSRSVSSFADLMETFVAQETGDETVAAAFRKRFDGVFGKEDAVSRTIAPGPFVLERLQALRPLFAHRRIQILRRIIASPPIRLPTECLRKTVDGLLKNAVENTPDQGRILVIVRPEGKGVRLEIRDFGIGLTEEARRRIFEGFYPNRDMQAYSSRRPFDFYAGGQGIDLLRTRIFSERYRFNIRVQSERCRHIPTERDICPGKISLCRFCRSPEDCIASGHTAFILFFPEASV